METNEDAMVISLHISWGSHNRIEYCMQVFFIFRFDWHWLFQRQTCENHVLFPIANCSHNASMLSTYVGGPSLRIHWHRPLYIPWPLPDYKLDWNTIKERTFTSQASGSSKLYISYWILMWHFLCNPMLSLNILASFKLNWSVFNPMVLLSWEPKGPPQEIRPY